MITLWAPKGGQGLSVTVAALAVAHLRRHGATVAIVDLVGDQPAVLGVEAAATVGVSDWLDSRATASGLARTALEVIDGLVLVPWGSGVPRDSVASQDYRVRPTHPDGSGEPTAAEGDRLNHLWTAIDALADVVLIDAGVPSPDGGDGAGLARGGLGRRAVEAAPTNIVVLRACYLALRRFGRLGLGPDGVLFLREPRRALLASDLESTVGAPVLATVEIDPSVARATDAGLLASRLPRRLERTLADVIPALVERSTAGGGTLAGRET